MRPRVQGAGGMTAWASRPRSERVGLWMEKGVWARGEEVGRSERLRMLGLGSRMGQWERQGGLGRPAMWAYCARRWRGGELGQAQGEGEEVGWE